MDIERVPMSELRTGDRVHDHGMIIEISDPRDYESHSAAGGIARNFKGKIVNDFHPFGWKSREWAVQSIPCYEWFREKRDV